MPMAMMLLKFQLGLKFLRPRGYVAAGNDWDDGLGQFSRSRGIVMGQ